MTRAFWRVIIRQVSSKIALQEEPMDGIELVLLYDYYGDLLTDRQRECFEMRYYQDLSLGEIAAELGISRQGR